MALASLISHAAGTFRHPDKRHRVSRAHLGVGATLRKPEKSKETSLASIDRQHILKALKESDERISGPRGAAVRLGLKRTTLQSKLKRLGIK